MVIFVQVLEDVKGSLTIFEQQIKDFIARDAQIPSPLSEILQLQTFLSTLLPDIVKLLSSMSDIMALRDSKQLKQNYTVVVDTVSALRVYSVHHLRYTPNITPSDMYVWLGDNTTNFTVLANASAILMAFIGRVKSAVLAYLRHKLK